ncbi:uncharacterized protein RSE6_00742 [Rhynchosporium secalis]|uniref:Uncharacterized protein n=1 Tax=Rhynchosporium secalis TaxID=38038 RepID=A0A1E1LW43_RHYSE|nr:uncharacterized protein RSE6_00742 [Rhynchosporium secalis]
MSRESTSNLVLKFFIFALMLSLTPASDHLSFRYFEGAPNWILLWNFPVEIGAEDGLGCGSSVGENDENLVGAFCKLKVVPSNT